MNSDLMIFAIFGLILTILFVLVFVKDLEVSRKFSRYEKAIEGLIQELHAVKKQVANLDRSEPAEFDAAQIESSLEQRLNEKINQKIKMLMLNILISKFTEPFYILVNTHLLEE